MSSAVWIFIFSCPPLCLIKSEWLQSFPLGSFPSNASLCDLIRHMIHAVGSLVFLRRQSRGLNAPTAPAEGPHVDCVFAHGDLQCVCGDIHYPTLTLYVCVDVRERRARDLASPCVSVLHMKPWVLIVFMLGFSCMINSVNPLAGLHEQAAHTQCMCVRVHSKTAMTKLQPSSDNDECGAKFGLVAAYECDLLDREYWRNTR